MPWAWASSPALLRISVRQEMVPSLGMIRMTDQSLSIPVMSNSLIPSLHAKVSESGKRGEL